MRWLDKLKKGLQKTARVLSLRSMNLDELEESLLLADVGVQITDEIVQTMKSEKPADTDEIRQIVRRILIQKML